MALSNWSMFPTPFRNRQNPMYSSVDMGPSAGCRHRACPCKAELPPALDGNGRLMQCGSERREKEDLNKSKTTEPSRNLEFRHRNRNSKVLAAIGPGTIEERLRHWQDVTQGGETKIGRINFTGFLLRLLSSRNGPRWLSPPYL
jgi:hypothetical protein